MNFTWQLEGLPPKNQIVLIAIVQPEDLTGPNNEPTQVWMGYWNGSEWFTTEGDSANIAAWMDFPIPPFVAFESTVGVPNSEVGPEFHVESFKIPGLGRFFTVKCGEQILAVRGNKLVAVALMQRLADGFKAGETPAPPEKAGAACT